jgi:spore coat protein CotH
LYTSLFEQKTLKNNYDMKLLINILEFITKSSDTEFEDNLHKYIDIDSYTNMLVMEQILQQESYLL